MKHEGDGKGEVYIKVVLKSGDYKLRKSETKALEVLDKVFAEKRSKRTSDDSMMHRCWD